jgi:hypothetical protein
LQALLTESSCIELPALFYSGKACHRLLLQVLLTESLHRELPISPSPVCSKHPALSVVCPFLFLVYYSLFFEGQGLVCPGAILVYPRGGCGNTACHLFIHLLVCISQAGLEPVSGSTGALLFSQCNMAWRSFVRAGGRLGCQSFAYSWWSFFAKRGSSVSERVLIYRGHTVCFLPLVNILDPP